MEREEGKKKNRVIIQHCTMGAVLWRCARAKTGPGGGIFQKEKGKL